MFDLMLVVMIVNLCIDQATLVIFALDTAIGLGIWLPFMVGKSTALLSVRMTTPSVDACSDKVLNRWTRLVYYASYKHPYELCASSPIQSWIHSKHFSYTLSQDYCVNQFIRYPFWQAMLHFHSLPKLLALGQNPEFRNMQNSQ